MTKEEFIVKYGEVLVTFSSYYKFTFTYSGTLPDGKRLSVDVGGNSDDIYRDSVTAGQSVKIAHLYPYSGSVYDGTTEVESFYDY